jgi:hypothetical protein
VSEKKNHSTLFAYEDLRTWLAEAAHRKFGYLLRDVKS